MDPGERVSQEARKIEIEQIQEFMREGIQQRIARVFRRGSFTQVIYDPIRAEYIVSTHYVHEGKKFVATARFKESQIVQRSEKLEDWKKFLESTGWLIRGRLTQELLDAGIKTIGDTEWQDDRGAGGTTVGRIFQKPTKLYEMGNYRPVALGYDELMDFPREVRSDDQILAERQAEQDAIESIKRSAQQVESGEQ